MATQSTLYYYFSAVMTRGPGAANLPRLTRESIRPALCPGPDPHLSTLPTARDHPQPAGWTLWPQVVRDIPFPSTQTLKRLSFDLKHNKGKVNHWKNFVAWEKPFVAAILASKLVTVSLSQWGSQVHPSKVGERTHKLLKCPCFRPCLQASGCFYSFLKNLEANNGSGGLTFGQHFFQGKCGG